MCYVINVLNFVMFYSYRSFYFYPYSCYAFNSNDNLHDYVICRNGPLNALIVPKLNYAKRNDCYTLTAMSTASANCVFFS